MITSSVDNLLLSGPQHKKVILYRCQVGRSGVDRASSSDARSLGFEPWPLRFKKIPLLYPETLEVPIRGRVQLRILELGDEARE